MCLEILGGLLLIVLFGWISINAIATGHFGFGLICFAILGGLLAAGYILHCEIAKSRQ